jgi:cell division protein FtsW (lipid II flippase)
LRQSDKISAYLEIVRQQIRWKKAQPIVLEEIENHIIDQKDAFMRDGLNEEEATARALAEMGDPVVVGEQLDRTHRPKPDYSLLALTSLLVFLGLMVQFSISSNIFLAKWMFERQIVWSVIAVAVMFIAYFADFTIIGRYHKIIFSLLSLLVFVCYLFTGEVHGRSVKMVYLLLLFPTFFAGFVYNMRNKGYGGLILCGLVLIIPAFLAELAPSAAILFLLCVSCLFILTAAVFKGWFNVNKKSALFTMYIPTVITLLSVFLFILMRDGYVSQRLQVILNPYLDPRGAGYVTIMIRRLLTNSRFIGQGLPISGLEDYTVFQLLPEVNTNYLLIYLIYRFGWITFVGIITLLAAFIIRAVIICRKQKSVLGFLISLAIISTFAIQCIIYIASNLGFMLFAPLSLPLISYGGGGLVINMALIGILLSLSRTGYLVRDKMEVGFKKTSFIQYDNGRVIIDLKRTT